MLSRGVGVILLDGLGNVVNKNSIAKNIVNTTTKIWFSNKKLCVMDDAFSPDNPRIKNLVSSDNTKFEKDVYIKGDSHSSPIKLSTIPIIDNLELDDGVKTKWLVLLTDTSEKSIFDSKSMGDFYNLTPAELSLASSIFDGLSLKEHAKKRGTSITTVRWTLDNVFSKTHTNSQILLKELTNKFVSL